MQLSCSLCIVLFLGCGQKEQDQGDASLRTSESQTAMQSQQEGDVMDTVENGSIVLVDYVGTLDNGDMFDTSIQEEAEKSEIYNPQRTYQPLQVVMGQKQVIPGFEEGLMGMKVGESKTVAISPEKAYGPVDEQLIQHVPVSAFKDAGIEPIEGEMVRFQSQSGRPISALIQKIADDSVVVDMNHPLTGKTLNFSLTVRQILQNKGVD